MTENIIYRLEGQYPIHHTTISQDNIGSWRLVDKDIIEPIPSRESNEGAEASQVIKNDEPGRKPRRIEKIKLFVSKEDHSPENYMLIEPKKTLDEGLLKCFSSVYAKQVLERVNKGDNLSLQDQEANWNNLQGFHSDLIQINELHKKIFDSYPPFIKIENTGYTEYYTRYPTKKGKRCLLRYKFPILEKNFSGEPQEKIDEYLKTLKVSDYDLTAILFDENNNDSKRALVVPMFKKDKRIPYEWRDKAGVILVMNLDQTQNIVYKCHGIYNGLEDIMSKGGFKTKELGLISGMKKALKTQEYYKP